MFCGKDVVGYAEKPFRCVRCSTWPIWNVRKMPGNRPRNKMDERRQKAYQKYLKEVAKS
jgi:hypothetical protein